ncbi:MAG: hypothetical protein HQL94_10690 [Magnetococcales bacterium]|nr:hypothetical protein [Magnetococcales bacterium]
MSLFRILLLLVIGYLLYRFIRYLLKPQSSRQQTPPPENPTLLVRCHHCNTLIPPENTIRAADQIYCSEKCRQASSS